jgi:hypothetical protein
MSCEKPIDRVVVDALSGEYLPKFYDMSVYSIYATGPLDQEEVPAISEAADCLPTHALMQKAIETIWDYGRQTKRKSCQTSTTCLNFRLFTISLLM